MEILAKVPIAFMGGFLSFISPCVLPLVPSYISFITGISFEELTDENDDKELKKVILYNSLMFILGFSVFFVLILGASANLFGQVFLNNKDLISKIGGAVIIFLGLHIIGVINFKSLQNDKRLHIFKEKPAGLLGSFFVGVGFAAGWTPCIGPILAQVFLLATTSETPLAGVILFIAYSMGLAIPFLLTALGINKFLEHFQKLKKHMRAVSIVTGSLLIATGLLIFFNLFSIITGYFNAIIPSIG